MLPSLQRHWEILHARRACLRLHGMPAYPAKAFIRHFLGNEPQALTQSSKS